MNEKGKRVTNIGRENDENEKRGYKSQSETNGEAKKNLSNL